MPDNYPAPVDRGGGTDCVRSRAEGWQAELALGFERRAHQTVLRDVSHRGPLRVQRPFYPERDGTCHVYVLHPPGGVVGGDELTVRVRGRDAGRALVTTPGATKLYKSGGQRAELRQTFALEDAFCFEWLPQETIAFEGARASLSTHVKLAVDASYAGWEVLCLGRPAAGERFASGQLRMTYTLERAGKLLWVERARFDGGDAALTAPWGLSGRPVVGTFVVAPAVAPDESWVEAVRAAVKPSEPHSFAVTLLTGVLVLRYLGSHAHEASALFRQAWGVLRPRYARAAAVPPRIWHT